MSMLGEVFGSLETMSQWQLLLAFIACISYAFAQGGLLPPKGRRYSWVMAAMAAVGFAAESSDWTFAAMLFGFAVAGMGIFVALVWVTSKSLGFERGAERDVVALELPAPSPVDAKPLTAALSAGPAHSH